MTSHGLLDNCANPSSASSKTNLGGPPKGLGTGMKYIGIRRKANVKKPKMPSHPTACRAGTLCLLMNFSSYTIWQAVMIWAITINKSPENNKSIPNVI